MRKTCILLYFTILYIALCTSCGKEPDRHSPLQRHDFDATTTDYVKGRAKTTLSDFTTLWKVGDRFTVIGSDDIPHSCHATQGDTATAIFNYDTVPASAVSCPYTAIYPSSVYASASRIILPPSYTSATGALTEAPMYAFSQTRELTFHNLCGLACITITGQEYKNLYYVIINADKNINGIFDLENNPDNPDCPQLSYAKGGSTSTILRVIHPTQSNGDFYIPIPAGRYNSLSVYLQTFDNTYANALLNNGSPVTIKQNAITPFILNDLVFRPNSQ